MDFTADKRRWTQRMKWRSLKSGWIATVSVLLLAVTLSRANTIEQFEPVNSVDDKKISFRLTNDDNGAIYDSYEFSAFVNLAAALWALPHNQSNYSSMDEMLADWSFTIQPEPIGEVNSGWNATLGSTGKLTLNNIGGRIDRDYDGWYAQQQNPNQNEMYITSLIPNAQLDGNGDGWSVLDADDFSIVVGTNEVAGMGVARTTTGFDIPAPAFAYELRRNGSGGAMGVYVWTNGDMFVASVTNCRVQLGDPPGGTQFVCSGWTGTSTGSGTNVSFVVTNDREVIWNWGTNYLLSALAGDHGSVNVTQAWVSAGSSTQITAFADEYYGFTNWTGDAAGSVNPVDVLMDGAKGITAEFAALVTTSNVPLWW